MNPASLIKIMNMKRDFDDAHPKFNAFLQAVSGGFITEGSVITLSIQNPNGEEKVTNLKVTAKDLEMFNELTKMVK